MMELRKYHRILGDFNSFVELYPFSKKVGHIIDVSMGGLGFQYLDIGDRVENKFILNMWVNNVLYLQGIKVEMITDFEMPHKSRIDNLSMRRCGVQYEELTKNQVSRLLMYTRRIHKDRLPGCYTMLI